MSDDESAGLEGARWFMHYAAELFKPFATKRQLYSYEYMRQAMDLDMDPKDVPDAQLNGDPDFAPDRRLPGNAHFSFPGCEGDALLMLLDARDIECSTGSACSAGVARPSHVLLAMGHDEARARGSLRFSLGHTSTAADVDALVAAIGPVVERARAAAQ